MALIRCPECGKEISDKSHNCIHCGYPLTNGNDYEKVENLASTQKKSTKIWRDKFKHVTASVGKINPSIRIAASVVIIIIALICLVQGKNALNDDNYDFYKEHYQDCLDGYEECMDNARTSGYLFQSTYESLAEDYEEMAEDDLAKINGYRIKATIFYVVFAVLALAIVILLHGINFKKAVADISILAKDSINPDLSSTGNTPLTPTDEKAVQTDNTIAKSEAESELVATAVSHNTSIVSDAVDNTKDGSDTEDKESSSNSVAKSHFKKWFMVLGVVAVVFVLLNLGTGIFDKNYCEVEGCGREAEEDEKYCNLHLCMYGNCSNKAIDGGLYCYTHTCRVDGCNERVAYSLYGEEASEYCSEHKAIYSQNVSTSNLTITNKKITHNSSYTVFTATMTNNGAATYEFVTVKGAFVDKNGTVCDTDSTYAVGSEGLAPGESTSFRMSISKNRDVTNCNVSIVDYDIDKVNSSLIDFD